MLKDLVAQLVVTLPFRPKDFGFDSYQGPIFVYIHRISLSDAGLGVLCI